MVFNALGMSDGHRYLMTHDLFENLVTRLNREILFRFDVCLIASRRFFDQGMLYGANSFHSVSST